MRATRCASYDCFGFMPRSLYACLKASTLLSGNFDDWDSLYLVAIRGTIPDKEGAVRWVPELEVRRCGEHMEEACLLEDASPEVMQDVRWVGNYIKRCEAWRRAGGTL